SLITLLPCSLCALFFPWAAGWGEKKCFNNVGRCRASCKSNEKEHSTCLNKKMCCVPLDKN
uniref:Beta-defensin n=1 Tax=Sarcophilus harrisii TaxID=9305 RepID=A0A7N4PJH4_SARHA